MGKAEAYSLEPSKTKASDVVVQLVHILVKGILMPECEAPKRQDWTTHQPPE
jgi:hypothetical protein